jgi:hypothetical protein
MRRKRAVNKGLLMNWQLWHDRNWQHGMMARKEMNLNIKIVNKKIVLCKLTLLRD